jgi:PhnB protein
MLGGRIPKWAVAPSLGGSPVTLYLTTESADKMVAKAVKLGATVKVPVAEMFWGDRCGTIVDPEGNNWMIATHVADPTPGNDEEDEGNVRASRKRCELLG